MTTIYFRNIEKECLLIFFNFILCFLYNFFFTFGFTNLYILFFFSNYNLLKIKFLNKFLMALVFRPLTDFVQNCRSYPTWIEEEGVWGFCDLIILGVAWMMKYEWYWKYIWNADEWYGALCECGIVVLQIFLSFFPSFLFLIFIFFFDLHCPESDVAVLQRE